MNKALFLDRDGILNVDKGYVYKWEDIIWMEEIFDIIKMGNDRGYKVIVLTNQSGIHKGMYTEHDVHILHDLMNEFLKNKNLIVDDWFYCAEMDSELRKPRPGMLLAAQKKYDIDFSKSFMVGDKSTDIFETDGKFVRPKTLLVKGAYHLNHPDIGNNVEIYENHADIKKALTELL
jgi:D,D-heptose 1,7-bisphosphate phosphatase